MGADSKGSGQKDVVSTIEERIENPQITIEVLQEYEKNLRNIINRSPDNSPVNGRARNTLGRIKQILNKIEA